MTNKLRKNKPKLISIKTPDGIYITISAPNNQWNKAAITSVHAREGQFITAPRFSNVLGPSKPESPKVSFPVIKHAPRPSSKKSTNEWNELALKNKDLALEG